MYRNINLRSPITDSSYISKENILKLVSEYQIFAFYLGTDFSLGKSFCSPLRKDNNPSFNIYSNGYGLRYRDCGTMASGDCFQFVSELFGLTFKQSLIKIALDFNIPLTGIDSSYLPNYTKIEGYLSKITSIEQNTSEIGIKRREWKECDKNYWLQYGITSEVLTFYKVFPVETAVINNIIVYTHKDSSPCYAYLFYKDNKYSYKLYQPLASKKHKWKSNIDKSVLQGWSQLPPNDSILIITKSLKDVMVFYSIGISSIAMQSETSSIKLSVMNELRSRFDTIYVLQDYDRAGILGTYNLTRIYPFLKWFFIQDKTNKTNGLKDVSDYIKNKNKQELINLIYKKMIEWK